MISVCETLQQIEAIAPPGAFRDSLVAFRKDIFLELPDQTLGLFRRVSLIFVEHFPADEATWQPWHHRAKAMFTQAQSKWMQEQGITRE